MSLSVFEYSHQKRSLLTDLTSLSAKCNFLRSLFFMIYDDSMFFHIKRKCACKEGLCVYYSSEFGIVGEYQ